MANNVVNLDAFKTARPAAAFVGLDPTSESLADGIGSSYGVIGYKGKVWSLRYRGEKHTFVRPDDGSPASYIDVIILRQAGHKSKSLYEKYDPNASEGVRPICASLDGITPDADVAQKQSTACAICPRNVWHTNADGKKVRACTDYKRMAVLLLPKTSAAVLGQPLLEPVFLRVPPASLNDLALFGETMAGQGWHFSSFITRISFDPDQPHPKMVFTPLQPLTDAEAPVVLPMRDNATALRITGEGQVPYNPGSAIAGPPAAKQIAPPPPAPAPAPAPAPVPPPSSVNMFDGFASPPPPPAPAPAAVANAPADVGTSSEADDAIDAKIKQLLASKN